MDDSDICVVNEQSIVDAHIKQISAAASYIPRGQPGECYYCGEDCPRLISKACPRCRDKRGLP